MNYYHGEFYQMLYKWWQNDELTGRPTHELVKKDMDLMKKYGINFLHLYIWDNTWFTDDFPGWQGMGFNPIGQNPCASDNKQWQAIDDFLTAAESRGIYVGIHFVSYPVIKKLNSGISAEEARELGHEYFEWTEVFIEKLSARHGNIIMWGMIYGFGPAPGVDADNAWNAFFKAAYEPFYKLAKDTAPFPGLGKVGINLNVHTRPMEDGYHNDYDPVFIQRQANTPEVLGLPRPDIFMLQLYNHNSGDIFDNLLSKITGPPLALDTETIKPEEILVVEFGTSTSVEPWPYGNNTIDKGDALTPSLTLNGHDQWLKNNLCVFSRVGINKIAFWTFYDNWYFWSKPPFNASFDKVNWSGFWGLKAYGPGVPADTPPKPALNILSNYYKTGNLSCSPIAKPVVSLHTNDRKLTVGRQLTLGWTATDMNFMTIDNGIGQVRGSTGAVTITPEKIGFTTYTIYAENKYGDMTESAVSSVTVEIVSENNGLPRSRSR